MLRRASSAVVIGIGIGIGIGSGIGVLATSACHRQPADELRHLPRDATAVWSIDVGALLDASALTAPGPLASLGAVAWREGLEDCDVDLEHTRIVGAGVTLDDLVIIVSAPGLTKPGVLRCVGAGTWVGADPLYTLDDDEERLWQGDALVGQVLRDDIVLFTGAAARDRIEALIEGSDEAFADPIADAIAAVEHDAAAWMAVAAPLPDTAAGITSAVASVHFDDGAMLHAIAFANDADARQTFADALPTDLADVARWIYAPARTIDRAEIKQHDDRVDLRMTLSAAEWRGLDLRWIDERRGIAPPPESVPEPAPIEPPPAVEEEAVAVAVAEPDAGPTGVAACDEYIRKYEACIDHTLPPAVQETSREALRISMEAWKMAAATPAGREGLAQACKVATEAVSAACHW